MVCYVYFSIIVRSSTVAGDVLSEILKLGVLLKLEEMFGTNLVNIQTLNNWSSGKRSESVSIGSGFESRKGF